MATDEEAMSNECIDNLIMNVIKSIRNMKKVLIVLSYVII